MSLFKNKYRVESTRLESWDYSENGYYYVTICTKNRECSLGNIINEKIHLSINGNIVLNSWKGLSNYFQNIALDEFIIMPNHLHGIIIIDDFVCRDGVTSSLQNYCKYKPTLGQIIGYFKYKTTKDINVSMNSPGKPFWQPRFYERIIRNEIELYKIRDYIRTNPLKWRLDNKKN